MLYLFIILAIVIIANIPIKSKRRNYKSSIFKSVFDSGVKNYYNSSYYKQCGRDYRSVMRDKGSKGEYMAYKEVCGYEKAGAKFLFNIYAVKGEDTSEIDVTMICHKGIFVFESKNYSGWIFGDEKSKTWTQCLKAGKSSHKEHFYNPIMQNRTHIDFLRGMTGEVPMRSVVVFSDRCRLKNVTVTNSDIPVVNSFNLRAPTDRLLADMENVLNDDNINELYNHLFRYTQVPEATKTRHIQRINDRISENSKKKSLYAQPPQTASEHNEDTVQNSLVCPWCGGKLVLRESKKGKNTGKKFYGCAKYPACHYIRNITDK